MDSETLLSVMNVMANANTSNARVVAVINDELHVEHYSVIVKQFRHTTVTIYIFIAHPRGYSPTSMVVNPVLYLTPRTLTALHCTALHCTALHCTALDYTTLR